MTRAKSMKQQKQKEKIINVIIGLKGKLHKMDNCVIEFYRKMIKLSTDPVVEMGWN